MFRASDKSTVTMTELLERAIARLKTLTASEQDAIAAMILEAFVGKDTFGKLTTEAMAEYCAGKTEELNSKIF